MPSSDSIARQRFATELDVNFSVQASAGAGKTTALVARVAQVAAHRPELLSRLVVVTYTNRAADEMRQRLRTEILSQPNALHRPEIVQGLARQFIGTIHGFCLRLLQEHAFVLGYPSELISISEHNPAPFRDFLRASATRSTAPWLPCLHRLVPERDLIPIAKKLSLRTVDWHRQLAAVEQEEGGRLRTLRLDPAILDAVTSSNASARATIARYQQAWKTAAAALAEPGAGFVSFPPLPEAGGADLKAAWPLALAPLEDTFLTAARLHVLQLAAAFQEFRLQSGQLYFSDQIILANRLLENPALRTELLGRGYRILLDEAQDTDPLQFRLLTELARDPASSPFSWPTENGEPSSAPLPGHFVMVGDQQQAIYRDRASLALYQHYHEALCASGAGKALTFSQTFRCRPAVVSLVNHLFAPLLDGRAGQATFTALDAQPDNGTGQAVRWQPQAHGGNSAQRMNYAVHWLADRIESIGLAGLRARHWGEVAVLCPKRAWLLDIQEALRRRNLPTQLAFEPPNSEFPEYLWLTALLTVQAEPNNAFEIIGVLRELYGIADDAIYHYRYSQGPEAPVSFGLRSFENPQHPIETLLHLFHTLRETAAAQPLPEAVATWVQGTQLRERLHALPDGALAVKRLDQLLLGAHAAQRRGLTLTTWAAELRENLEEPSAPVTPDQTQGIQLMTFQKSKGLQWDAVLIPFLGKQDSPGGKSDYPKILCPPEPAPLPGFLLQNGFQTPGWEEAAAAAENVAAQERRRLYYVACTRARHTLVLVDDACVWTEENKKGVKLDKPNGYEALASTFDPYQFQPTVLDGAAAFLTPTTTPEADGSPLQAPAIPGTAAAWPETITGVPTTPPSLIRLRPSQQAADVESAAAPKTTDEEGTPALSAPFPAYALSDPVRYGLWWHETMRLGNVTEAALTALPETLRERGKKELAAYLRSELHQTLQTAEVLREVPYTRALTPGSIEEGVIDLLFRPPSGDWILLDWKTDQGVDPRILVKRYSAQLAAYASACHGFGLAVRALKIYSTTTGQVVDLPPLPG